MNSQWVGLRGEPKSQLHRTRLFSSSELWRRQDVRATQHTPTSTNNTTHTYNNEQHITYLHPRKTQHIPTPTNKTAHTHIHEQHNTHLHPRKTQHIPIHEQHTTSFVNFEAGEWDVNWYERKAESQELEFLQRTQKVSINFILYCSPQVFPVLCFFKEILISFM